jgi:hypothetical protein
MKTITFHMKTKLLILTLFALVSFKLNAQTEYSTYMNKAMEKLEEGDCDAAQKFYNVYKELSEKSVASFEVMIDECKGDKKYTLGDTIMVGAQVYKVAYIRDGGRHGLAVREAGWKSLQSSYTQYVLKKGIPTTEEMKLIYENRDYVRLYNTYFTCTSGNNNNNYYVTLDFATGKTGSAYYTSERYILLIHRF